MNAGGKWAIITGASSGIGKALAFEFAGGGFNVFLTGRNDAALAAVAAECSRKFHVSAEVVSADLSIQKSVDGLIAAIRAAPHNYEVLVNNAGFGIHGEFASTDLDEELRMLNVQLAAALRLTKAVLPSMIARRSGRILNVASVYSFAPVPYQAVYSACKAFLFSFSSSLQTELRGTGVTVTVFCPGTTQTEFRERAGIEEKHKNSGIPAEAAAQIAFVGTLRGKYVIVPGFWNHVFVLFSRFLPAPFVGRVVKFINQRRVRGVQGVHDGQSGQGGARPVL